MKQESGLFGHTEWRIIDQTKTHPSFHALYSFAMDDTLCTSVRLRHSPAVMRGWVHHNNVVLGNVDYKLSGIREGLAYLKEKGYLPIVRNSGGAAVVLDAGVLNLSLILPAEDAFADIHAGYRTMAEFIRLMLEPYGVRVETGEVAGSYCPGDFDVNIDGRKFGGLAQRRRRGAVAVQAFLLADGSGSARAELVRGFYDKAACPNDTFPFVRPETVASLSELIGREISSQDLMQRAVKVIESRAERVEFSQLLSEETEEFAVNVASMEARNPHL
ncbi:octanoyl-[GcvH]:protein N-octanoyltransferase [Aneurinibacillus thermoaerophilus]|uniref:Octanoyl-[GcvH]:protein N-octanoyltransferase n=1 Tax=Aneurinibacillus thermoaerophilus TaxID=143495 RepID=A0A1G7YBA9_ANETH|nr:lipoate--protein ligase family protein [Aneurinibacillus thermoaerophilus]SDG93290.1 octanoyl-[GcvH]:protein N-octanoyltransferase [Aneurinibacillus thermoaerophilus]